MQKSPCLDRGLIFVIACLFCETEPPSLAWTGLHLINLPVLCHVTLTQIIPLHHREGRGLQIAI